MGHLMGGMPMALVGCLTYEFHVVFPIASQTLGADAQMYGFMTTAIFSVSDRRFADGCVGQGSSVRRRSVLRLGVGVSGVAAERDYCSVPSSVLRQRP